MLRLIGSLSSNYCNMVKIALLEKGAAFGETAVTPQGQVLTRRSGETDWATGPMTEELQLEFERISPAGKVPVLQDGDHYLTETSVILEYLNETLDGPPLFPSDAADRARVRELVRHIELYVELPARNLAPILYGAPLSAEIQQTTKPLLERGFRAVSALATCSPFAAGPTFSAADIYAHRGLLPAAEIAKRVYEWDVLRDHSDLARLLIQLDARDSIQQTLADHRREQTS